MIELAVLSAVNQLAALIFSSVVAFLSFIHLNACSYRTWIVMRFSLIMTCTASMGVIFFMMAGKNPHWLITVTMLAVALQMYADRRKPGV